jgi:hypothetical protein
VNLDTKSALDGHPIAVRGPRRYIMATQLENKHLLDTSAWNALFEDPERGEMIEALETTVILPTTLAVTELAATENGDRRQALIRLVKSIGKDNRPLATPNQLIIFACQGYARRDRDFTLNGGDEANGAWNAINQPNVIDAAAQRLILEFNKDRENVFRDWNEGLRPLLQRDFGLGASRPRSLSGLIRHYSRNEDFLYEAVNPIYERAVGSRLPRAELWSLLKSVPHWRMFLIGYACAIYQRAIKEEGFGHKRNPGHLDLWSATYLPFCEVFITNDKRQRRALKILNRVNSRPARIVSFTEWKKRLLGR